MKIALTIFLTLALSSIALAQQETALVKKNHMVSAGIGYPNLFKSRIEDLDSWDESKYSIPVYFQYEHAVMDRLSVGAMISYSSAQTEDNYYYDTYKYKFNAFYIGARAMYYYVNKPKILVGSGLSAGYLSVGIKATGDGSSEDYADAKIAGLAYQLHLVNFKYFFTPKIAAHADLTFGLSVINAGLTVKF